MLVINYVILYYFNLKYCQSVKIVFKYCISNDISKTSSTSRHYACITSRHNKICCAE